MTPREALEVEILRVNDELAKMNPSSESYRIVEQNLLSLCKMYNEQTKLQDDIERYHQELDSKMNYQVYDNSFREQELAWKKRSTIGGWTVALLGMLTSCLMTRFKVKHSEEMYKTGWICEQEGHESLTGLRTSRDQFFSELKKDSKFY